MRLLFVVLLSALLTSAAALPLPPRAAVAMQTTPVPPTDATKGICTGDEALRGATVDEQFLLTSTDEEREALQSADGPVAATFDPESDRVGVVYTHTGYLSLSFLTLPPHSCRLESSFDPAAIITPTSGTVDIYVQSHPSRPDDAPDAAGFIYERDGSQREELRLPGVFTVTVGEWVHLQSYTRVGFWNPGASAVTVLVAADHPPLPIADRGCSSGCNTRGGRP